MTLVAAANIVRWLVVANGCWFTVWASPPKRVFMFLLFKKNKKVSVTNCLACGQLCSLTIFLHPSITFCSSISTSHFLSALILPSPCRHNVMKHCRQCETVMKKDLHIRIGQTLCGSCTRVRIHVRAHVGLCHFLQNENTWEHYRCLPSLFLSPSHCDAPRSSSAPPPPSPLPSPPS